MAETLFKGIAYWPGITSVIRASYTLHHGVTPGVCSLEIQPQSADIAEYGTLTFAFGVQGAAPSTLLQFADCKVDKASFRYDEQGMVWALHILDRRWRWNFGELSHTWNERSRAPIPFGNAAIASIDARTEETPQNIARKLLAAMGETLFDVSGLPNDGRPETYLDFDNPARALAELCDSLSCRVALGADGIIRLVRAGIGADLPDQDVMRRSGVIDPPEKPSRIMVVGARTLYQVDFRLEAVGLDTNDVIKPIDSLSYKPALGWGVVNTIFWDEVAGWSIGPLVQPNQFRAENLGRINPREYAARTVYRWYRIKMEDLDGSGLTPRIPGWDGVPGKRIDFLWQILPIEDEQVEGYHDALGVWHRRPAEVFGSFAEKVPTGKNTPTGSFCYFDFSINKEQGIVEFSDTVYRYNAADEADDLLAADKRLLPALLVLRCTVTPQDADTRAWDRFTAAADVPGAVVQTKPRIVKREEIVMGSYPIYDPDHQVTNTADNFDDCKLEAQHYLDATQLEYVTKEAGDAVYLGLKAINPDGAIQMVTWSVGPDGAWTRASLNTEWSPVIPTFRERRAVEKLRENDAALQQLQDQERKGKR